MVTIVECPVCGNGYTERIRMYTYRPNNRSDRIKYEPHYDWCNE